MKQIYCLVLTFLLICGIFRPIPLIANELLVSTDNQASDKVIDATEMSPPITVSPSAITLTFFDEVDPTDAVAFSQGISQEKLSNWFTNSSTYFTGYDAQGNSYDLFPSAWIFDAVDTNTPGLYYAWVEPNLKTDYILADGVSLPRQLCAVSIQKAGEPDINCCVSARGFLRFPWVLSPDQRKQLYQLEQLDQLDNFATIWLRKDNSEWLQLSEGFLFVSDALHLSQRIFEYESIYDLQIDYPSGQTGVLTFQYDWPINIINHSGGDRDGGDVSGGGSSSGSQPAPTPPPTSSDVSDDAQANVSQDNYSSVSNKKLTKLVPASPTIKKELEDPKEDSSFIKLSNEDESTQVELEPKQTSVRNKITAIPQATLTKLTPENVILKSRSSANKKGISLVGASTLAVLNPTINSIDIQPEVIPSLPKTTPTVNESYSPEETIISGLRLRDLCTDEESVVFGSGDLTVSIPSSLLSGLYLSDSDTLAVRLTQPNINQAKLEVEAFGKSITELSGTVLRLRYTPHSENPEIIVRNESNENVADVTINSQFLSFRSDMAGTYTILETLKSSNSKKATSPLGPLLGSLILATGGITIFRRKHHG